MACLVVLNTGLSVYLVSKSNTKKATVVENTSTKKTKKTEPQREATTELLDAINAYLSEKGIDASQVGISIRSFDGIDDIQVNADAEFTAASTYKLPLAVIYYEKVNNGEMSLQDELYYNPSYFETGAGTITNEYSPGSNVSLEALLNALIIESDNTAGHILFENLGGWQAYKQEAAKYAHREMDEAFYSLENDLTANYAGDLLSYIYENKKDFQTLLENMQQSKPNDYLDKKIVTNVAQKYGFYNYACNAIGIVQEAKVPYSIAVYTTLSDTGIDVIGDINEMAYNYFNN